MASITHQMLSGTLRTGSLFAIATGLMDVSLGSKMISVQPESDSSSVSPTTAIRDSQIRFLGSMWAGYGIMLWWASNDLRTRREPLALLGAIMFVGGVGRALSGVKYGFGAPWIRVAMWVELVGPGALYLIGRMEETWA